MILLGIMAKAREVKLRQEKNGRIQKALGNNRVHKLEEAKS